MTLTVASPAPVFNTEPPMDLFARYHLQNFCAAWASMKSPYMVEKRVRFREAPLKSERQINWFGRIKSYKKYNVNYQDVCIIRLPAEADFDKERLRIEQLFRPNFPFSTLYPLLISSDGSILYGGGESKHRRYLACPSSVQPYFAEGTEFRRKLHQHIHDVAVSERIDVTQRHITKKFGITTTTGFICELATYESLLTGVPPAQSYTVQRTTDLLTEGGHSFSRELEDTLIDACIYMNVPPRQIFRGKLGPARLSFPQFMARFKELPQDYRQTYDNELAELRAECVTAALRRGREGR